MPIEPKTLGALMAAAALGLMAGTLPGGGAVVGTPKAVAKTQAQVAQAERSTPPKLSTFDSIMQAAMGSSRYTSGPRRWPGRGWSVAEDRRRAKKRRNVARNRRAHRGSK